jgi:hypothetical protein
MLPDGAAYRAEGTLALAPQRSIGLSDARLSFLASLTLAPLYALVDLLQQVTPGPDTVFSEFYALPWGAHLFSFIAISLGVWLAWYTILRATGAHRRDGLPLARLSHVRAARPLLRVYLAVVLAVLLLVALRHGLTLGLAIQAALLLFTYLHALVAGSRLGAA